MLLQLLIAQTATAIAGVEVSANISVSQLSLNPTRVRLYELSSLKLDCNRLYNVLLEKREYDTSMLPNALERRVHDVLSLPEAELIRDAIIASVRNYMGEWWEIANPVTIENRALIIEDRGFINTHRDSREGDVTAVFFLTGQEGRPVNSVGNPRFVLEDERMYFDEPRLPWEGRHGYSICPSPGLCVVFPARVPHNQHPFRAGPGGLPHMQIVANFKFENMPDLEEAPDLEVSNDFYGPRQGLPISFQS